jgi:hypothetical protein
MTIANTGDSGSTRGQGRAGGDAGSTRFVGQVSKSSFERGARDPEVRKLVSSALEGRRERQLKDGAGGRSLTERA